MMAISKQLLPFLALGASAVLTGAPAQGAPPPKAPVDPTLIAEEAVIYGYPRVLAGIARHQATNAPAGAGAPVNQFRHLDPVTRPGEGSAIRPNTDVLMSSAWLDLSKGPLVLHIPETQGRFYSVQMMDAWTNTFAVPGTRMLGSGAHDLVILGPTSQAQPGTSMLTVRAPTNTVLIVGRLQIGAPEEMGAARTLQQQFTLAPLGGTATPATPPIDVEPPAGTPRDIVAAMDGVTFLRALAAHMAEDPLPARDTRILVLLQRIGLYPGQPFEPSPALGTMLDTAKQQAEQRIVELARSLGVLVNGWHVLLGGIGDYGVDYGTRAAVAMMGLGASPPQEVLTPVALVDDSGRVLSGDRRYILRFAAGQTPPVDAFWSLTLYDANGHLVENEIGRYAIRGSDALVKNEDGSIDLFIQSDSPGSERAANWLPSPAGKGFNLTMRLYLPRAQALTGAWRPPQVVAVSP